MRRSVMLLLAAVALVGATVTSVQADLTSINVPGDYDTLQVAINAAQAGVNYVLVEDTYTYASIVMKSGVPVLAAEGNTPIIDAGTSTAIAADWPSNATSATVLDGFVIRGGTSTVVRVRGSGIIRNCEVDDQDGDPEVGIESAGTTLIQDNMVYMWGDGCTGILATGGQCTIEGCDVLVLDHRGIYAEDGTIRNNHVRVTDGVGIWLAGGSITVSQNHVELYSGHDSIGIDVWGGDADYLIEDCLVESSGGAAYGMLIGVPTDNVEIRRVTVVGFQLGFWGGGEGCGVHHCIADGTTYAGFADLDAQYCIAEVFGTGTQGTGSVAEAPLFCDLNGSEYTLRVDSYGNPENNASGELIGAFPVACMYGTLARDSEYAGDGTLEFPGDLTVPSGSKLILGAGTTLDIAKADSLESGTSSTDVELIVNGRLEVNGTSGSPVVFDSEGATHAEADWYGVRCGSTSKAFLEHVNVKHAYIGISMGTADSARVRHAVLSDNEAYDISVGPNSYDYALVDSCDITIGSGIGIYLSGTGATIAHSTLTGSASSSYGITTYLASSAFTLTGNSITGLINGPALNIATGTPVVTKNVLSGCKYGIYTYTGSYTIGAAADTSNHNTITGNSTAGILADGASATPAILTNNISSNTYGVTIKSDANPNLGDANQDGNNKFLSNTTYCIWNRNPSRTVSARGNYFGECGGGGFPVTCWYGSVDTNDYLCTAPFSMSQVRIGMGLIPPARALALRAAPNPTGGRTTLHFEIDGPAEVEVQVFDVAGRLVRRFGRTEYGPGEHAVFWDGATAAGQPAPAGIYFFRAIANDHLTRTARVLVVR